MYYDHGDHLLSSDSPLQQVGDTYCIYIYIYFICLYKFIYIYIYILDIYIYLYIFQCVRNTGKWADQSIVIIIIICNNYSRIYIIKSVFIYHLCFAVLSILHRDNEQRRRRRRRERGRKEKKQKTTFITTAGSVFQNKTYTSVWALCIYNTSLKVNNQTDETVNPTETTVPSNLGLYEISFNVLEPRKEKKLEVFHCRAK